MIRTFRDRATYDIAAGLKTKEARRRLPVQLHSRAQRLLAEIDFSKQLSDLKRPSNRLHPLTGDRRGQYSVSINEQYRICFVWKDGEALEVEITDYH